MINLPIFRTELISDSSTFSKSSLNIWKFTVHLLLKPDLENFEHYFASLWDECNCAVVWTFVCIYFLWDWNENWPCPVLWPLFFSKFVGILSAALSQQHILGFEIAQLEFHHQCSKLHSITCIVLLSEFVSQNAWLQQYLRRHWEGWLWGSRGEVRLYTSLQQETDNLNIKWLLLIKKNQISHTKRFSDLPACCSLWDHKESDRT